MCQFISIQCLNSINPKLLSRFLKRYYRQYLESRGFVFTSEDHLINAESLYQILGRADHVNDSLVHVLAYIQDLATLSGLDVMLTAAKEHTLVLDFSTPTPADIALQMFICAPEVIKAIHQESLVVRPRTFSCYIPEKKRGLLIPNINDDTIAAIEQSLGIWFEQKHYGRKNKVYTFDHDKLLYIVVKHGLPAQQELLLDREEAILYRAQTCDVVKVDYQRQEIAIQGTTPEIITLYRREIGKHFFGCENYFATVQQFTLNPLKANLSEALICSDIPGISLVRLTELHTSAVSTVKCNNRVV